MDDPDVEVLQTFKLRPGLLALHEVAQFVGCSEYEALERLSRLESSGYLLGPIFGMWGNDEWAELGYGLSQTGRDALQTCHDTPDA
jgi:hypothetical protein